VSDGVVIPFVDKGSQATFNVDGSQHRQCSRKAIVMAQPQVVASTRRRPCTCLHIVTKAVSEESAWPVNGAMRTRSVGGLFGGICVIIKSKCIGTA
jgi:hypothetical protein